LIYAGITGKFDKLNIIKIRKYEEIFLLVMKISKVLDMSIKQLYYFLNYDILNWFCDFIFKLLNFIK